MEDVMLRNARLACLLILALAPGCSGDAALSGPETGVGAGTLEGGCTIKWLGTLDTDLNHPKDLGNDLSAAYASFLVTPNPRLKYILRGSFPMVRFLSVQTYSAQTLFGTVSYLYDYQTTMDAGSFNPYQPGVAVNAWPRSYTVEFVPAAIPSAAPNVVRMGTSFLEELMMRFYSPDSGIALSTSDLPSVSVYDTATGSSTLCRADFSGIAGAYTPRTPSDAEPIPEGGSRTFSFKLGNWTSQGNAAATYLGAQSYVLIGEVAVIRFKAPGFANTHSGMGCFPGGTDSRYWSLCADDAHSSQVFGCLPDYLASPDANGDVTVVVSTSSAVQAQAGELGQNFLFDPRPASSTMGFTFRILLPSPSFMPDPTVYPAAFLPTGRVCTESEYLCGACVLPPPPGA